MSYTEYIGARRLVVTRYVCEETGLPAYEFELFGCAPINPLVYQCGFQTQREAIKAGREQGYV